MGNISRKRAELKRVFNCTVLQDPCFVPCIAVLVPFPSFVILKLKYNLGNMWLFKAWLINDMFSHVLFNPIEKICHDG